MANMPETVTFNVKPKRPHVTAIWILAAALLLSLVGNFIQVGNAKRDKIAAELNLAKSNTVISGKQAEIAMHQATINEIRKDRSKDSLQAIVQSGALKSQIAKLRFRLAQMPGELVYDPDSLTVDSINVSLNLRDSVINTQALMITSLEIEKTGIINSFYKEISQLEDQREAQVDISNQLQNQLVESQTQTRKEVRKKKVWRFIAGVGVAAAGILLLKPN